MRTLKELILESTEILEQHKIANSRRQAEEVIADALHMRRLDLYLQFDRPLKNEEFSQCIEKISRRSRGEPFQYIKGLVKFLDSEFFVDRNVLIPRNETEILAAQICCQLEKENCRDKILWDICTGSGCLGISIKKKIPELTVVLSDLSASALEMARKNAFHNSVAVNCLQGNLFEPFAEKKADFIVCNPPYISEEEYTHLEPEVRCYEPKIALVAEDGGFEFYKRIAKEFIHHLNPRGKMWLEMGYNQGKGVLELFQSIKGMQSYIKNDWSEKNRFFFLEME